MRGSLDPKVTRLRRIPGMGTMSDAELAQLARLVDECDVPAGTVLVRQGAIGRSSYVIVEGWAAVSVSGTTVAALGPGDHIGEMAMLDDQPRSATVTAKSAMRLLEIGPAAMSSFLEQADVLRAIAVGLAGRVRAADAKAQAAR
jgi:CRP/FNR family transcriptional regulator, cyclic AMP receptor protein